MSKVGNNVEVVFLSSKNNQMHEGQKTMMAGNKTGFCPAKLLDMYFRRLASKWRRVRRYKFPAFTDQKERRDARSRRPSGSQRHKSKGVAACAVGHESGWAGCDRQKLQDVGSHEHAGSRCSSRGSSTARSTADGVWICSFATNTIQRSSNLKRLPKCLTNGSKSISEKIIGKSD